MYLSLQQILNVLDIFHLYRAKVLTQSNRQQAIKKKIEFHNMNVRCLYVSKHAWELFGKQMIKSVSNDIKSFKVLVRSTLKFEKQKRKEPTKKKEFVQDEQ